MVTVVIVVEVVLVVVLVVLVVVVVVEVVDAVVACLLFLPTLLLVRTSLFLLFLLTTSCREQVPQRQPV